MPKGEPFTQICAALSRPRWLGRVDLHLHTTHSDGTYTPYQVVELARRSGLSAIAVTDHDTLSGIAPAQRAAGAALAVVSGVEITAEFHGKELHLLGYRFDPEDKPLGAALTHLRQERVSRFHEMIERLALLGVRLDPGAVAGLGTQPALGRRHLAELLVTAKKAASVREAFQRYLGDHVRAVVPKTRLPVDRAIALVHGAGGITSWAHPGDACDAGMLRELRSFGLNAVEAEYPAFRPSKRKKLRQLAADLGLAITGGSDCHGPGEREVGAASISAEEWQRAAAVI